MIFKNASGVHSSSPSPFFRRRFRSQKRNAADVRREVPAAESPTAKGTLDVVGAEETGEDRHEQEPSAVFPCWSPALSRAHRLPCTERGESRVAQCVRRRGMKGLRDPPRPLSQARVPAARPHTAPGRALLPPSPDSVPPSLPPPPSHSLILLSAPALLFPIYHSSPLLSARHLLYFLCVPIKPNIRRFAPLGARPSDLSGLDRTTSSSLSPDHAPFPLQSPGRPPPSDDASPSQVGGTPDQCPVAPHVSAAEPLSVHPSGQANTHTAPNAGAPLQLTLASLGTSRPGHCTSASERHTDRS